MMTTTAQLNYVKVNHPEVFEEMEKELAARPIDADMIGELASIVENGYYRPMYIIAASLLLYSPATLKADCTATIGLLDIIASSLGVSKQAISKRIPSVRQYYKGVGWFKDNVDSLIAGFKDIQQVIEKDTRTT
ncbi:hypothetical protein [Sphingobacterium kyonggiense]